MKLRRLSAENTKEIKTVILEIFTKDPWNDVWTDGQLQLYVDELINNSNPLLLGLYENESLIGISLGRIKHWCSGAEYWIDEFGIIPEKQSKGAGTEFLKKIKRLLTEEGISQIVLLTEKTTPAYNFYQKNGFYELKKQAFLVSETY